MATWVTHLRITDLTNEFFGFDGRLYDLYIAGNLAPDSGALQADGIHYDPPRKILHHTSDDGKTIYFERFYAEYVENCTDNEARAFYLGYYVHLLTDDHWAKEVYLPMRAKWTEQIDANRRFVWRLKKQWYDLDREYLSAHVLPAYERLKALPPLDRQYLDYIPIATLNGKLRDIAKFYDDLSYTPDAEYVFLTQSDVDDMINRIVKQVQSIK